MEEILNAVSGMEYGSPIDPKILMKARLEGFIIVYGYSDDVLVIQGAVDDEFYSAPFLDENGVIRNECDDGCPYYEKLVKKASTIEWKFPGDITHHFEPVTWKGEPIHHREFFVMEDGSVYCRGFVARLEDFA